MNLKIQFNTPTERQSIIEAHPTLTLIEEQNVKEGNFLIFSDTEPIEIQMQELKSDNLALMDAFATLYEGLSAKGVI
jgi:hypothetical protein